MSSPETEALRRAAIRAAFVAKYDIWLPGVPGPEFNAWGDTEDECDLCKCSTVPSVVCNFCGFAAREIIVRLCLECAEALTHFRRLADGEEPGP
jgi:hypothetical protein